MQRVNYDDISFEKLKKLDVKSMESTIYLDEANKQIYKIFRTDYLNMYELSLKSIKLELLEKKKNIGELVIPNQKIFTTSLVGVREEYIDGIDLCDIRDKYNSMNIILDIILDLSKKLKKLHKKKIIVSDLNFGNIRVDKDNKVHFLDSLSYKIDGVDSNVISAFYDSYIKKNGIKRINIDENSDKISFILSFLTLVFEKDFFDIDSYDYDEMKEKIKCLNDMEEIFDILSTGQYKSLKVPYLHEVIKDNKEDYIYAK